jgi:hypothetical protein
MPETIQHYLAAPVPMWLFTGIVALLWLRDYSMRKAIEELNEERGPKSSTQI